MGLSRLPVRLPVHMFVPNNQLWIKGWYPMTVVPCSFNFAPTLFLLGYKTNVFVSCTQVRFPLLPSCFLFANLFFTDENVENVFVLLLFPREASHTKTSQNFFLLEFYRLKSIFTVLLHIYIMVTKKTLVRLSARSFSSTS